MPLAVREISAAASTRYQEPCLAFNTSTSPPEVSNKSYSAVRDEYYGQLLDLVDALSKTSSGGLGSVPIADSLPHQVEGADALSQNQIKKYYGPLLDLLDALS